MIKGKLKIDLSNHVSECGIDIDATIEESECLSGLTSEQKLEISNIVHMNLLNKFDDLKINVFGGERGN